MPNNYTYSLSTIDNSTKHIYEKIDTLENVVRKLYYMFSENIYDVSNIVVTRLFNGVDLEKFHFKINDNLVMYNEYDTIRLISLFPEYYSLDVVLVNRYSKLKYTNKTAPMHRSSVTAIKTRGNHPMKNISRKRPEKLGRNRYDKSEKQNDPQPVVSHPLEDKYVEDKHDDNIVSDISFKIDNDPDAKFRMFKSDKQAFFNVKKDVDNGNLDYDDINPAFILKYDIMKVLENRNSLNQDSDDNIHEEYKIFTELYDSYTEPMIHVENEEPKIYIPHDFLYWSNEEKEKLAEKYSMSVQELENLR